MVDSSATETRSTVANRVILVLLEDAGVKSRDFGERPAGLDRTTVDYLSIVSRFDTLETSRMPPNRRVPGHHLMQSLFYGNKRGTNADSWIRLLDNLILALPGARVPATDQRKPEELRELLIDYQESVMSAAAAIDKGAGIRPGMPLSDPRYDSASRWREQDFGALYSEFLRELPAVLSEEDYQNLLHFFELCQLEV